MFILKVIALVMIGGGLCLGLAWPAAAQTASLSVDQRAALLVSLRVQLEALKQRAVELLGQRLTALQHQLGEILMGRVAMLSLALANQETLTSSRLDYLRTLESQVHLLTQRITALFP